MLNRAMCLPDNIFTFHASFFFKMTFKLQAIPVHVHSALANIAVMTQ